MMRRINELADAEGLPCYGERSRLQLLFEKLAGTNTLTWGVNMVAVEFGCSLCFW